MPALGTHPLATDVRFAEQFSSGGFPRLDDTGAWTIALFNGAVYDAGGYLLLDGDAFARVADNLNLVYPFTIACEVYVPSSGGMALSVSWADDQYAYINSASGNVIGQVRVGGTFADSPTGAGLPGSTWAAVAFVCTSATSRQIWLNGTFGTLNTDSATPSSTAAEFFTMGALSRGGGADSNHLPNGSRIRNVVVWQGATNGAMTDTKLDQWAAGPSLIYSSGAPTVSSPTVVSTGNGIATVRVTTDTAPSGSSTLAVRTRAVGATAWTAAEVLAAPTATITSGASGARDFNLTGLTNGTALAADFAQTGPSNVVSTGSFTPSTVPGAPTIGTAVAGNAQATVNGTAPGSTGGSAITGYRSTATPGGSTVTGASLPITHTGLTNGTAYTFTLAAQNANGYGAESAASNSVTPSAPGTAPNITVQPSNQTVTAGATATFSVTATGSGLTYQWRRNGTNISGATSSSYTTPATTVSGGSANNGDIYSVVVTGDTAPAATSSNATLTVNAATGTTLEEVMTDSTGSSIRLNQTTRVCLEPFTTIEALFTGTRTVVTGTTDPTTGRFVVPSGTVPPGKYAMFQLLPSTGAPAALQGAAFDIIDVV